MRPCRWWKHLLVDLAGKWGLSGWFLRGIGGNGGWRAEFWWKMVGNGWKNGMGGELLMKMGENDGKSGKKWELTEFCR